MTQIAQFEIHHSAYLGPDGKPLQPLPARFEDRNLLTELYRHMVLTRHFDSKAIALQRTGRLGTYASSLGQEAIGVGVASAMQPDDVLLPSFREHGAQIYRGVTLTELFLFWGGDERGSAFEGPANDFPVCITVGGHAPHAAGVALGFQLRGQPRVAVCMFGDGATSKGDVYEAMNLAGARQLPIIFVVSNNQWAISTPRAEQSGAQTLAQKALAAGFNGEQVDGNDIIAVQTAMTTALANARAGKGPHLLECVTYRLADHTTSDDATRYRDDAEVSEWWQRDPLARLRLHLTDCHGWGKDDEVALLEACKQEVETAAAEYLATPPQPPESTFDYLYATLPQALSEQREHLLRAAAEKRGG